MPFIGNTIEGNKTTSSFPYIKICVAFLKILDTSPNPARVPNYLEISVLDKYYLQ